MYCGRERESKGIFLYMYIYETTIEIYIEIPNLEAEKLNMYLEKSNPRGRPRRPAGRISTVNLSSPVEDYIKLQGWTLAHYIDHGHIWHSKLLTQAAELAELREGAAKKDALIRRLHAENLDLMRFKEKTMERIREGVSYGN